MTEHIPDGAVMILESVMHTSKPMKSIEKFTAEALEILHRRLKYFSITLKKAGPVLPGIVAGG